MTGIYLPSWELTNIADIPYQPALLSRWFSGVPCMGGICMDMLVPWRAFLPPIWALRRHFLRCISHSSRSDGETNPIRLGSSSYWLEAKPGGSALETNPIIYINIIYRTYIIYIYIWYNDNVLNAHVYSAGSILQHFDVDMMSVKNTSWLVLCQNHPHLTCEL